MESMIIWAFDFDGVLCDSAYETCMVALQACRKLFKYLDHIVISDADVFARFIQVV